MDHSELKKKSLNAVFWNIAGSAMKQGISFVLSIFLARILSPADFGLVGMATVFVTFTQGFADMGLSSGLIRTKDPTQIQYSSVFFFNLAASCLLALGLYSSAGLIADFYHNEEVKPIAQFISYSFITNGLTSVHWTIFYKNLEVKILRISAVVNALVSGLSGLLLAYLGYGVWSMVYSSLLGSIALVIVMWKYSSWRPSLVFHFSEVRKLIPFSSRVFFANYLDEVYSKVDIMVIGKMFQPATLGQYFRASSFNQLVTRFTSQGLSGVLFPVFSRLQDNDDEVRRIYNKALQTICFLSFFLTGLLYINAEPLIILLFSAKWTPAIHYFEVIAFGSYVFPMAIVFNSVIYGKGHANYQFKVELIKKGLGVAGLCIGFYFGLEGYLWASVIAASLGLIINLYFVNKAIHISIADNIRKIYSYLIPLTIAGVAAYLLQLLLPPFLFLKLICNTLTFSLLYMLTSHLLKMEGYLTAIKLLREFAEARIMPMLKKTKLFT